MANRRISEQRKTLYYAGMASSVVGLLTFGSVFVSFALSFGKTDDFDEFGAQGRSMAVRAVLGMGLLILGGILKNVGARGLAGSGVVLDPQRARKDVEPWARMAGGVVGDALDEAGLKPGRRESEADAQAPLDFEEKLRKLHRLRQEGILTEEEYQREKAEILDSN